MYKANERKYLIVSGAFITVLLILSFGTVFMLNKENPLFSSKRLIYIDVKNAQNLKNGAAVQLKGIKIGTVQSIQFKDIDTIRIHLGILEDYSEWIRQDAYAAFKTQGVLGDKFVEILGGTEAASPIKEGDVIRVDEVSTFDQIITKSEDIMVVAGSILAKLDKMLGPIENNRLDRILYNIESMSTNSSKILQTLNDQKLATTMSNFHDASKSFKSTSESLSSISKQIESGPGTMHSLIYDQTLHEDVRSLMGGANRNKVLKYFIRESIKKDGEN